MRDLLPWPTLTDRLRRDALRLGLPTGPASPGPVPEQEIEDLPEPAQRLFRFSGTVGGPRVWSFRARLRGAFRLGPDRPWMPLDAVQYNSAPSVTRLFHMRLDLAGVVPMFGADTYVAGRGRMRGKVLDLVTVVEGSGPEFDVGELVTYLNDACLVAPSMLLTPEVDWHPVDGDSFDVSLTDRGITATARVVVDEGGAVRDFTTTDRYCALPSGLVRARWTTPVKAWTTADGRPVPADGKAVWHLPDGEYTYVRDLSFTEVESNLAPADLR